MRPLPRPKRGGEEFAREHHGTSSKKPRFDTRNPSALAPDAPAPDEEEDLILEADEIGKRGQQTKRNAVNIDGYESDSDNENFDARAAERARVAERNGGNGQGKSKDEEQEDMFADLEDDMPDGDEDEELAREGKPRKKNVRFLERNEIEGQVDNSRSGGHVSSTLHLNPESKSRTDDDDAASSTSDSSVSDEERAEAAGSDDDDREIGAGGKKKHAPKLDAFNMKAENEEGRFDEQQNYVRKAADPDAIHDSWLEGVSRRDMKRAKEAAAKREEDERRRRLEDDQILNADVLRTLIPLLERGETILEALARLNKGRTKAKAKAKPKWQTKQKNRKNGTEAMDVDAAGTNEEDPAETSRREAVEAITGAADILMQRGQAEIYDEEREMLMRQYRRETGSDWEDPSPADEAGTAGVVDTTNGGSSMTSFSKHFVYRWADARDGGEKHGPYEGTMMQQWNEAGYFGGEVEFREVDSTGAAVSNEEWTRRVDFI